MDPSSHQPQGSPRGSVSSPAPDVQQQMSQLYSVITGLQQQLAAQQQQQSAPRPFLPKIRPPSSFAGSSIGFAADTWISDMESQLKYYGNQFVSDVARIILLLRISQILLVCGGMI